MVTRPTASLDLSKRLSPEAAPPPDSSHTLKAVTTLGEGRPPPDLAEPVRVVMATFNGARWLPEQLESIAVQTRLPDQILVFDDGSTDRTLDVVNEFSLRHPRLVHVIKRSQRLGATANFLYAIEAVPDGIVILSDQDDIWRPDRIERTLRHLETADAVFSDAQLINDIGTLLPRTLWETVGFTSRRAALWNRDPVGVLLRGNVVTGATLAFRRASLDPFLPIPRSGWHDLAIAVLVGGSRRIVAEPEALIRYRLHDTNTAGPPPRRLLDRRRSRIEHANELTQVIDQLAALEEALSRTGHGEVAGRISEKRQHVARRYGLPVDRRLRLLPVVRELLSGRYHRFGSGLRSAVQDLLAR